MKYVTIPASLSLYVLAGPSGPVDTIDAHDRAAVSAALSAGELMLASVPTEVQFVRDFVRRTLLADRAFGADAEALDIAALIRGAFSAIDDAGRSAWLAPGDVAELEDAWHARLVAVAAAPTAGYNPAIGAAMARGRFFLALREQAKSEKSL